MRPCHHDRLPPVLQAGEVRFDLFVLTLSNDAICRRCRPLLERVGKLHVFACKHCPDQPSRGRNGAFSAACQPSGTVVAPQRLSNSLCISATHRSNLMAIRIAGPTMALASVLFLSLGQYALAQGAGNAPAVDSAN